MTLKQIALAALVATSAVTTAHAAAINGTGSVGIIGVTGAPAGLIDLGTTFTFTLTLYSGGTGDLSGIAAGTTVTTSSITATNGSAVNFTSTFGSFSGTVQQTNFSGTTNRVLDLYALGTFTPAGTLSTFDAGAMSLTFTANQTVVPGTQTGAISASYTIASPPVPLRVPEPGALALVGLAMAGLVLVRKSKKA